MKQRLESTGCFKAVKVTIDTSELYENHSPNGHQIIFDLDEKLLNLSTHTGNDFALDLRVEPSPKEMR